VGYFGLKKKAIKACIKPEYFYGPIKLNQAAPDESEEWEGCIYPYYQ
jgi:hypothetical protein